MNEEFQHRSIQAEEYTRDYYLTCCQGYDEFITDKGRILPLRLSIPLELAQIKAGMTVIDIGCGRGEIILNCALSGARAWGLDYSYSAVELSKEILQGVTEENIRNIIGIQQANAISLPFQSNSSDVIFMLDVVEHLLPDELSIALDEIWRILKPGGRLIIHTMPNIWYYNLGYPIFRLVQRLRGEQLPKNPRERWTFSHVHVNEQTPIKLLRVLNNHRFNSQVWLRSTVNYSYEDNFIVRKSMEFITTYWPLKLIFCNDIFAICVKE